MTETDAGRLTLRVDVTSPVPVYEQLREQVTALVGARQLVRGDRLPAARALAADLGLAVGTVARAYRELEATGVVQSRRRTGTVVAGPAAPAPAAGLVADAAADLVRIGRAAGWTDEQLVTALRAALLR
ncbi:GntR family transcriptional regulator [Klenkia taihuensis]|uniref:GntR family transcriptional regulator n=1 Tax=Klenkia taihuensis TaxID=1225127 RepID=A0A1I1QMD5_9ACTN|nr:GntR family transcriptional regulator [Klenkia taihuensis]GHE07688.1 GntR family transcriptional regulator [Klenkia taihuensis]SFD23142.1 GntR family transcriptional regulator [Klenkia taihuensis]